MMVTTNKKNCIFTIKYFIFTVFEVCMFYVGILISRVFCQFKEHVPLIVEVSTLKILFPLRGFNCFAFYGKISEHFEIESPYLETRPKETVDC